MGVSETGALQMAERLGWLNLAAMPAMASLIRQGESGHWMKGKHGKPGHRQSTIRWLQLWLIWLVVDLPL